MSGFDVGEVRAKLKALAAANEANRKRALFVSSEHVLGVSRSRVPIEEGTLERSGSTHVAPDGTKGYVYYDTVYAVVQHEDMTLQHDAGRQAKYLESAFTGEKAQIHKIIANELRMR